MATSRIIPVPLARQAELRATLSVMYVSVDIGGTKTLVASLNDDGVISEKIRFETSPDYDAFLSEARQAIKKLRHHDFRAGGIGAPGRIDRLHGRVLSLSNLPWRDVPLVSDLERIAHCPLVLENDAKMAALSEAMMVKHEFQRVLYVTVSTGIGYGLVVNQKLDTNIGDTGGTRVVIDFHGKHASWEKVVSGRAIVKRFGKQAREIDYSRTWHAIARDLSKGLTELIAITEPDVIIFGGSVGTFFSKFGGPLHKELVKYKIPLAPIPHLQQAARPEEAVLFGCYDLAKEHFAHAHAA